MLVVQTTLHAAVVSQRVPGAVVAGHCVQGRGRLADRARAQNRVVLAIERRGDAIRTLYFQCLDPGILCNLRL